MVIILNILKFDEKVIFLWYLYRIYKDSLFVFLFLEEKYFWKDVKLFGFEYEFDRR